MSILKFSLGQLEKHTFKLHLIYSLMEGFILGVLALNEFVFIKSLHGSSYLLSFLFQFSVLVYVFLLFFNEFLRRVRDTKKLLRITALITRLPLLMLAFFPHTQQAMEGTSIYHYLFLLIFLLYFLSSPIVYPVINVFLKNNYRHEHFAKLYSIATTANKIVMLLVTFLYGWLLDWDNYAFVYVFPITGILGIISIFFLSGIHISQPIVLAPKEKFWNSIRTSMKRMRAVLKNDRPFRHFEIGFGYYGFAFMSTVSVMYIFFDKGLNLNYSSVAFYRNSYNIISILLLPMFGRMMTKIDPRRFAVLTFASIFLYLIFLVLTAVFPYYFELGSLRIYYMLILFILSHSVFAATMALLWNIGSAYFCKSKDVGDYQSVHLFLTGVRGIFAPILGILFYELLGFIPTFIIGAIAILIGMGVMQWSYKKDRFLQT
ncbi:MAG: MFS transporter [Bacteroidota bacterium]